MDASCRDSLSLSVSSGWRGVAFVSPSIWSRSTGSLPPTWVYLKLHCCRPFSTHRCVRTLTSPVTRLNNTALSEWLLYVYLYIKQARIYRHASGSRWFLCEESPGCERDGRLPHRHDATPDQTVPGKTLLSLSLYFGLKENQLFSNRVWWSCEVFTLTTPAQTCWDPDSFVHFNICFRTVRWCVAPES